MIDFDKIEEGDLVKLDCWASVAIVLKKINCGIVVLPIKFCKNSYCKNQFLTDYFYKHELCMDGDQIICQ